MADDSGQIDVGNFALRYRIEGAGPPLLILGDTHYYPRVFSAALRQQLRLVFLEHRAFARPPAQLDAASYQLDTLLDDFERARAELGLGPVAVLGHSGHAYMALEYAKRHAASVSHVVMVGICPDLSPATRQAAERYWQESVCPERKARLARNLEHLPDAAIAELPPSRRFIATYVRNGPRIWFDPTFDSGPLWEGCEINSALFDHFWGEAFAKLELRKGLDSLDRPVLLALGRYDYLVAPPASWDPLRPAFRDLTVRVFERSGHTPQYEEPERFDAELLAWLGMHDSS